MPSGGPPATTTRVGSPAVCESMTRIRSIELYSLLRLDA
jgi:hypothetical protein